jgi:hypothetical protein
MREEGSAMHPALLIPLVSLLPTPQEQHHWPDPAKVHGCIRVPDGWFEANMHLLPPHPEPPDLTQTLRARGILSEQRGAPRAHRDHRRAPLPEIVAFGPAAHPGDPNFDAKWIRHWQALGVTRRTWRINPDGSVADSTHEFLQNWSEYRARQDAQKAARKWRAVQQELINAEADYQRLLLRLGLWP